MPKKKPGAAEKRVPTGKGRTRDPMQDQTPTARKRAAKGKGVKKSAAPTDRAQCTAHKRNGERCSNPPVRGAKVCRMHGGSAPQVRAKANQRLIEMVLPAMRELHRILNARDTSDADKLKAVNMVLNRTGYSERHGIDIGLREPTPFDNLNTEAFVIMRGEDNVTWDDEPHPIDGPSRAELPGGGEDANDTDILNREGRRHANRGDEDAESYLDDLDDADVVVGRVVQSRDELTQDSGIFGYDKSQAQRYRESGTSEFDRDGTKPGRDPWTDYEAELRRRIEDRKR